MNKFRLLSIGSILLLTGCGILTSSGVGTQAERLAACTGDGTVFATLAVKDWPEKYHTTVAKIIEAHIGAAETTASQQMQCTSSDAAAGAPPSAALRDLAKTLPPWKDQAKQQKLSESDMASVLLEYLRVYECALNERRDFEIARVWDENTSASHSSSSSQSSSKSAKDRGEFNEETGNDRQVIEYELALARSALDRSLLLIGGIDRLRPLTLDLECLKRASLDIRNITGLISQASACMPRTRDARGSLRDLSTP